MKKIKTKRLSVKLSDDYYTRFIKIAPEKGPSEVIRSLIDGGYYLCMPELAPVCTRLMDSIRALKGECSKELYDNLEREGKEVCRLLSIK